MQCFSYRNKRMTEQEVIIDKGPTQRLGRHIGSVICV